jgi:hypothetical protein
MAKLDEIMEVLTQEINGFNSSIKKLEGLTEKLHNTKVQADSSNIEFHLKDFLRSQHRTLDSYEKQMKDVLKTVKKSRWTPKWETLMLYVVICLNTIAFSYLGYYFIQFEKKREAAFITGKEEGVNEVGEYFKDHPVIYKDFRKWARKQDSVPNQK